VIEIAQGGEALGHDVIARDASQGRDKGDTTGVVLIAWVIQTLGKRES
jgi:hypothetical protein